MRPSAAAVLAGVVALAGGIGVAAAPPASATPAALTVQAAPGQRAAVVQALGRSGLRIQRRQGARLQVAADPGRIGALARLPGVAAVGVAPSAWSDQAPAAPVSQGLQRTGADVLADETNGGLGLTIAILDLGFGRSIADLQAKGELPPAGRLEQVSFDTVHGLAGVNAYGNRTNHGELVAQTVYDHAPRARYLFVNYHSEEDFVVATDFLIERRPDIVVHSNSFIEGPFDGTGAPAQAVNRVAAAGILWFNSAGNYAEQHWAGPWNDPDRDGVHDWPVGEWTFDRGAGQPITFALTWNRGTGAAPTDLDLVLERGDPAGWVPVAASRDRQSMGARSSERITGFGSPVAGRFRVRIHHRSGPEPAGDMVLFTREIPMAPAGGSTVSSLPTPGDAAGALAIGAVDWRGDTLKRYSSHGPSDDGRLKPDLVAPTGTRVVGPNGLRGVGGTSNAAPNAAGAAALLIATERDRGGDPDADWVRRTLLEGALDLGDPGPDNLFGHGRVRVWDRPLTITEPEPTPGVPVRGRVQIGFAVDGPSAMTQYSVLLNERSLRSRLAHRPGRVAVDTRTLEDGRQRVEVSVRNFAGNTAHRRWVMVVDNTRPTLTVRAVRVTRPAAARPTTTPAATPSSSRRTPPPPRRVEATILLRDGGARRAVDLRVQVVARAAAADVPAPRTLRLRPGRSHRVVVGALRPGRYQLRLRATDAAGNARALTRNLTVR